MEDFDADFFEDILGDSTELKLSDNLLDDLLNELDKSKQGGQQCQQQNQIPMDTSNRYPNLSEDLNKSIPTATNITLFNNNNNNNSKMIVHLNPSDIQMNEQYYYQTNNNNNNINNNNQPVSNFGPYQENINRQSFQHFFNNNANTIITQPIEESPKVLIQDSNVQIIQQQQNQVKKSNTKKNLENILNSPRKPFKLQQTGAPTINSLLIGPQSISLEPTSFNIVDENSVIKIEPGSFQFIINNCSSPSSSSNSSSSESGFYSTTPNEIYLSSPQQPVIATSNNIQQSQSIQFLLSQPTHQLNTT